MNVKTIKQKPPEEREEKASGVAAGISMGFSTIAEGLLQAHLPHSLTCSTRRTNRVEPPAFQVRRSSR